VEAVKFYSVRDEPDRVSIAEEAELEKPPAWELVETGRYRPRRIRGSLLGRELG
jgi:hypothetical protein